MVKTYYIHRFIKGTLQIHKEFNSAWKRVQEFYKLEIDPLYQMGESASFMAKLDSEHNDVVSLNFIINGTVIRHCIVKVDLAFFFPLIEHNRQIVLSTGFKYDYLKHLDWEKTIFKFSLKYIPSSSIDDEPVELKNKKTDNFNEPYFQVNLDNIDSLNHQITDDFGKIWDESYKIKSLSTCQIPSRYLIKYNLVGTYYHARYTQSGELDCVLFAEDDNPHDPNAIKVLRWLPQIRDKNKFSTCGNIFFDLGYISRMENSDLHKFMVENNSRILFAKCHDSQLELKGGINYIKENNLYYPSCLLNIKIHE